MKTKVAFMTFLSLLFMTAFSQNRVCEWDIEMITSVRVEIRQSDQQPDVVILNERSDIVTLVTFLRKTEFRNDDGCNFNKEQIVNQWLVKMIFKGQRDQILLMTNCATIGKTLFMVDNDVVEDVTKMVYGLQDL